MKEYSKNARLFILTGAILGWFAIVLQFYLMMMNRVATVQETVIRFFSFFTILTNILVAICFTILLFNSRSAWGRFFSRPTTLTAIAVYISMVGIVYNLILRFLWNPKGMQKLVDELLHSVNPVWFLLFWILFVPKSGLRWKHIFAWMLYPVFYISFILIRGSFSGFYPYPFANVSNLGYYRVFFNSGKIIIIGLLLSLLLVGIGKWRRREVR